MNWKPIKFVKSGCDLFRFLGKGEKSGRAVLCYLDS